jgi:hypothetical protein
MGLGGGSLDGGRRELEVLRTARGDGRGCVAGELERVEMEWEDTWRAGVAGARVARDEGRDDWYELSN